MSQNGPKKACQGVFRFEPIKARFSALIGWNRFKLYRVSCIEVGLILLIVENRGFKVQNNVYCGLAIMSFDVGTCILSQ